MMLGSFNPYKNRRIGNVPGPSWKPRPRSYRVVVIVNGQERFLGTFTALSRDLACEQCREEIPGTQDFNLIATEVQA